MKYWVIIGMVLCLAGCSKEVKETPQSDITNESLQTDSAKVKYDVTVPADKTEVEDSNTGS